MPDHDHPHGEILCPECDIKMWFDSDNKELFCPNCSFTIEIVSVSEEYL